MTWMDYLDWPEVIVSSEEGVIVAVIRFVVKGKPGVREWENLILWG